MTQPTPNPSFSAAAATMRRRINPYKLALWLSALVVFMFGFGYLMVPLYNVLCKALGLNGKTAATSQAASVAPIDRTRIIRVQFLATKNAHLPWTFYPVEKSIRLHPGENKRINYFAENLSGKTMTVQAIPSVSPGLAAQYLKKTECFCFNQQTLKSGESMDMPLLFHLDRALPQNIHVVTLSYTLFDATGKKITQPPKAAGRLGQY